MAVKTYKEGSFSIVFSPKFCHFSMKTKLSWLKKRGSLEPYSGTHHRTLATVIHVTTYPTGIMGIMQLSLVHKIYDLADRL